MTLRLWEPGDADAVFAAMDDEILRWIPVIPRPYRIEDARAFVEHPPDDVNRAVLWDGEVVGSIGMRTNAFGVGHLGYWCAARARGRGAMSAALRAFCREHPLPRLELTADPDNVASRRLAEAVGFREEGTLRSFILHPDGRRADSILYSLLPGELRG